jgi:hypothetical protein
VGTPMYAIYPSRRGVPTAVRALLAFLEEGFQEHFRAISH